VVPYATGTLSAEALTVSAHLLMLPAMALAMLRRRDEYTAPHRGRTAEACSPVEPSLPARTSPLP
jgi:hypothetical protein